ncbi:hypothetical protein [Streptomyces sp. NBC_01235]|uniref:hypothetical protein n=1 Tax=Streptomyces sp. NBC_01235 TaxID=2903788 RepID=UPI002E0DFF2C|nr:hypothetical protein OG289_06720 [Streptomyces sp. NBC_01235]
MPGKNVEGLRRDAVGLAEVLSRSVTAVAPAAAVAASIPETYPVGLRWPWSLRRLHLHTDLPQNGAVQQ